MAMELVDRPITVKMERFAQYYVELGGRNYGAEAYRKAYDAENMEDNSIYREASLLLSDPRVAQRVREIESEALAASRVTVNRVVREYARLAFADATKLFDEDGNLRPLKDLDPDTRAALQAIETVEPTAGGEGTLIGRTRKVKMHPKGPALDGLARFLGISVEKLEVTGVDNKLEVVYVDAVEGRRNREIEGK